MSANVPYMVCIGNHERDWPGTKYTCRTTSLVPRFSASSTLLTFELTRNKSRGRFLASQFKGQLLVMTQMRGGEPGNEAIELL